MPRYLVTLSIGPVQDFIAAARRTRDLWFGSFVLSEVSKAAARSLCDNKDNNAELIFPTPENPQEDLKSKNTHKDAFNVGNKLLAIVETTDPEEILMQAKKSASDRWLEFANQAKNKTKISITESIWDNQINDILEFFSAWVKFENDDEYQKKRERLDQLINARKNTRNFIANPVNGQGIPKSSLDGLRESVLPDKKHIKKWDKRRAGLTDGEELDCTGVVKRLSANPEQFTPTSRIALDPWLRNHQGFDLEATKTALAGLVADGLVSNVNVTTFEQLPYDGQLLYPFRLEAACAALEKEKAEGNNKANAILQKLENLKSTVKDLYKDGEPSPYMAIIAADGDRMGELLDTATTVKEHQQISQALTRFATQVPEIVSKQYGQCVYAGGDDVLALIPINKAIDCAKELSDCFQQIMEPVGGTAKNKPSLSVGIGISHLMTPMGKQLDLARKAEKLAKDNDNPDKTKRKNALAILFQPRSGAEIAFRERWDNNPAKLLNDWINIHSKDLLPRRAAYNLREESFSLDWAKNKPGLIEKETRRILEHKRTSDDEKIENKLINTICERVKTIGCAALANELILTQRLAQEDKSKENAHA